MKARIFLIVFIFLSLSSFSELTAQNNLSKEAYPKWEVGLNGGYFIKPRVSIEPYDEINPNFLVLAKRNIKNGKNAIRFSVDVDYKRNKYNPGSGLLGTPFTASFAGLIGYEKRFQTKSRLRPYIGLQQSVRLNFNQALAEEIVNYPVIYQPLNFESKNQRDFILISDIFSGLEYNLKGNLFISAEVAFRLENFVGKKIGGYSFYWVSEDGINSGAIVSGGGGPNRMVIQFRPFTFLNLNYKFK